MKKIFAFFDKYLKEIVLSFVSCILIFATCIFAVNSSTVLDTQKESYDLCERINKYDQIGFYSLSSDNSSDIVWRNTGYVGYELCYRYAASDAYSFFISEIQNSTFSIDDNQINGINYLISISQNISLYKKEHAGDYMDFEILESLPYEKNVWEEYSAGKYCFVPESLEALIKQTLSGPSTIIGKKIIKKTNDNIQEFQIAGIYKDGKVELSNTIGNYFLINQDKIVYGYESCGIGTIFCKNDTQGIEKHLKYMRSIYPKGHDYVEKIIINKEIVERNGKNNKKLILICAIISVLSFVSLAIMLFLIRKNIILLSRIFIPYSLLFFSIFLALSQITSVSIYSNTGLIIDNFIIFFMVLILFCLIMFLLFKYIYVGKKIDFKDVELRI